MTEASTDDRLVRMGLILFAAYLAATTLLAFFVPGTFFEWIGPYESRNDHYTRDAATFQAVLAVAAFVAIGRVGWRVPVLALLALQFGLHSVSHFIDFNGADPKWLGPAEAFALALSAFVLGYLALRARRAEEAR